MTCLDLPFHRTVCRYVKADWIRFISYITEAFLLLTVFKHAVPQSGALISEWILSLMEFFTSKTNSSKKTNGHPLLCCGHISTEPILQYLWQERCNLVFTSFNSARNRCKWLLRNVQCSYMHVVWTNIDKNQIGSREYWKISSRIMNSANRLCPTL